MEKRRDQAIKLFGKTIQLFAVREVLWTGRDEGGDDMKAPSNNQDNQENKYKNEETRNFQEQQRIDEQEITDSNEEKANNQQNKNSNNSTDKTLKKPDKILPCPRCNSMNTKFCYFNNYNVNQPRHFCKNCQRYWTEGGSMRNVPAGAGRRKSKKSTPNYHNITIPNCAQADFFESISHPNPPKLNETVLSFESLNSNEEGNRALNSNLPSFPPYLNEALWPNPWSYAPYICSGLNSAVLGKRSRKGNIVNHSNVLRIGGNEKDEKFSEWPKLGFQNVKSDRILKCISTEASQVLCANPAALSRYLSFQERS